MKAFIRTCYFSVEASLRSDSDSEDVPSLHQWSQRRNGQEDHWREEERPDQHPSSVGHEGRDVRGRREGRRLVRRRSDQQAPQGHGK